MIEIVAIGQMPEGWRKFRFENIQLLFDDHYDVACAYGVARFDLDFLYDTGFFGVDVVVVIE